MDMFSPFLQFQVQFLVSSLMVVKLHKLLMTNHCRLFFEFHIGTNKIYVSLASLDGKAFSNGAPKAARKQQFDLLH